MAHADIATPAAPAAPAAPAQIAASGRGRDHDVKSLVFLGALWFSLFFGVMILVLLIVTTAIDGAGRFDSGLLNNFDSIARKEQTGYKAGIHGTIWLMGVTAVMAVPLGIAAALYLEEFADSENWFNRIIEVNIQNLAAVPSVIYGLLALAVMGVLGYQQKGIVLGGSIALAMLILPVIIITTREAVRSVPREIRDGSLALGATVWQTTWRQILPASVPGIATGTILALSRAVGEAAPLLVVGLAPALLFTPTGIDSQSTALPLQIYFQALSPYDEYKESAAAAIILLLVMILGMNALAIFIRNKFQRSW